MITRRDLLIALFSAVLTASAFAIADQGPVLGSTAFDFKTIPVKVTDVGSVRSFVNQRTATVDELEIHMRRDAPEATAFRPMANGLPLAAARRISPRPAFISCPPLEVSRVC